MRCNDIGLAWVVRALAQPAEVQEKLFPAFVSAADELVMEFEECFRPESAADSSHSWTGDQLLCLRALDVKFQAMSGAGKEEVWDDDDCLNHADWIEVRHLARKAAILFGWPVNEPPPTRDV
jgi:hypothetical protein